MTDFIYDGPPTGLGKGAYGSDAKNRPTQVVMPDFAPTVPYGTYPLAPTDPYPMPKTNVVVKVVCAGCGRMLDEGEECSRSEEYWTGDAPVCPVCDAGVILEREQWHSRHIPTA